MYIVVVCANSKNSKNTYHKLRLKLQKCSDRIGRKQKIQYN